MYLGFWFWFSLLLLSFLFVCIYYLWKFANLILKVQDSIEVSLDILDGRYKSMVEILETPIFFDSLEVRKCVDEIKKSRNAILMVANVLTGDIKSENPNKQLLTGDAYGEKENQEDNS